MPYANNNGVKIYYEVEGDGPPLMLAHGANGDLTFWRQYGYVDILKSEFQVVMFDARGFGRSDKPHDVSAHGEKMALEDTLAVLDTLGIDKAHYLGYSMGSMTGFRLATYHSTRFHCFFLSSSSPYATPEGIQKMLTRYLDVLRLRITDVGAFLASVEAMIRRPLSQGERDRWLATDYEAINAAISTDWAPLTDEQLSRISAPCLVYCGERDPYFPGAEKCVEFIPSARFISAPGLDHGAAWSRSDLMLPHIKEFLAQVSKK